MNVNQILDLSLSSEYDLFVDKDRSLNSNINCTYISGNTEMPFYFSSYSAATLTVKNQNGTVLMLFSTLDSSIILGTSSFKLVKSFDEMDVIRAGQYSYDMYLSNSLLPKRAFLRGKITFIQNISN